jgi:hypothetical protein
MLDQITGDPVDIVMDKNLIEVFRDSNEDYCWGFKNWMESLNICKKKLKNIRKKESENVEIRNLRKPDFLLQSCESLYTCPRTPFYRDTKGLLHSEITLESREYF